jgi:hypothetical protein
MWSNQILSYIYDDIDEVLHSGNERIQGCLYARSNISIASLETNRPLTKVGSEQLALRQGHAMQHELHLLQDVHYHYPQKQV